MKTADLIKSNQDLVKKLVGCKSYQLFLNLYLELMKEHNKPVSLGQLALKSGLSKSLIKGIIDGNKRITPKTIAPIKKALGLPPLLSDFFFYLVAQDVPEVMEANNSAKAKSLSKKYAQLALEEYVSLDKSDDFFKNPNNPIIYAALGTYDEGATFEDISKRTKLETKEIEKSLEILASIGALKIKDSVYFANRQFLFTTKSIYNSHFHRFYLHMLENHQKKAMRQFESQEHLFYSNVFSINEEDMKGLRDDLLEVLNRYVQKAENPTGNKIVTLQTAFTNL